MPCCLKADDVYTLDTFVWWANSLCSCENWIKDGNLFTHFCNLQARLQRTVVSLRPPAAETPPQERFWLEQVKERSPRCKYLQISDKANQGKLQQSFNGALRSTVDPLCTSTPHSPHGCCLHFVAYSKIMAQLSRGYEEEEGGAGWWLSFRVWLLLLFVAWCYLPGLRGAQGDQDLANIPKRFRTQKPDTLVPQDSGTVTEQAGANECEVFGTAPGVCRFN